MIELSHLRGIEVIRCIDVGTGLKEIPNDGLQLIDCLNEVEHEMASILVSTRGEAFYLTIFVHAESSDVVQRRHAVLTRSIHIRLARLDEILAHRQMMKSSRIVKRGQFRLRIETVEKRLAVVLIVLK